MCLHPVFSKPCHPVLRFDETCSIVATVNLVSQMSDERVDEKGDPLHGVIICILELRDVGGSARYVDGDAMLS